MVKRIKKQICVTLPPELNRIWGEYVIANDTNKSAMLEQILIDYFSKKGVLND